MSTSEKYDFGSIQNEEIIREAYERVGVLGDLLTNQKVTTALRSLNYILISWINKRLNLFTIKQAMLALNPGQSSYLMPKNISDVLKASLRSSYRNLGGTAASSPGGIADNAFDSNLNTSCAQTGPNGYISYTWGGSNRAISMIGVVSFVDAIYTLTAQFSYDGINWTNNEVLILPATQFQKNVLQWFSIPVPISAAYFRILETGGATLNIAELYFNNNVMDSVLSRMSWSEYHTYPNKEQPGTPSQFSFDRQIQPILRLYETPNNLYNCLFYTFKRQIQNIGTVIDTAEIPDRFMDAITSALSSRLAIKEKRFDIYQIIKGEEIEAFNLAAFEDEESVPIKIKAKPSRNWSAS
jgi:hypothetical protein